MGELYVCKGKAFQFRDPSGSNNRRERRDALGDQSRSAASAQAPELFRERKGPRAAP